MYEIIVNNNNTGNGVIVDKKPTKHQACALVKYMLDKGMVKEGSIKIEPTGRDKKRHSKQV